MVNLKGVFSKSTCQIIIAYFIAQVLYLLTLAPTLLWGDSAKFQKEAYVLDLHATDPTCHPFWVIIAHPFTKIPIGDVAFRTNLFTSVWAAMAVAFFFGSLRFLTSSFWASAIGAAALAVSHCFWMNAVQTEVYSFNMALLAIGLYCLLHPNLNRFRLLLAALIVSFAVNNHVMVWLTVPGLVMLAFWRARKDNLSLGVLIVPATVFLVSVIIYSIPFSHTRAISIGPMSYIPAIDVLIKEAMQLLAYLFLQFPSPAIILAVAGCWQSFKQPVLGIAFAFIFLANVVAVLNYHMSDKYVFYMLSYFVMALWAGLGAKSVIEWVFRKTSLSYRAGYIATLFFVFSLPIIVYETMPYILFKLGIKGSHLNIREIPGRPALKFFLTPSKRGYFGAREFAEKALNQLPPNATIIADYTVASPMQYLQIVEGIRPDITISRVPMNEQVSVALSRYKQAPLYLALTEPYYDIDGLSRYFTIVKKGMIYELQPRKLSKNLNIGGGRKKRKD